MTTATLIEVPDWCNTCRKGFFRIRPRWRVMHFEATDVGIWDIPEHTRVYLHGNGMPDDFAEEFHGHGTYEIVRKETRQEIKHKNAWKDKLRRVESDIFAERVRQNAKHPGKTLDCADVSPFEKLCVLMEEIGELAHELTYDSDHDNEKVYAELTQVAALAAAWMESFK